MTDAGGGGSLNANGGLSGTTGGQLLMTQVDYADFRIVASSNMVAVGKTGHLGICFWGARTPVGAYNKCKLIIPPGGNTWDYSLGTGLKGVTKVGTPTVDPTWNTTEILCFLAKGFCRVAINGKAVLTYQEPNLASIKAGPIGLQIHSGTKRRGAVQGRIRGPGTDRRPAAHGQVMWRPGKRGSSRNARLAA